MKTKEISLELKLTKEKTDDTWRGLTLGAKAMLEPGETLAQGSERLYEELSAEFKVLWGREKKVLPPKPAEEVPVPTPPAPPAPPEDDPSWCPIHETSMPLHEKGSQKWYSHKLEDGTWCNGKPPKEKPDSSYCPIHKVKMDLHEKGGKTWYSHKVGSEWCKGLIAKKEQG